MGSQAIDLSAGMVPDQPQAAPTQGGIDLSAGMVPDSDPQNISSGLVPNNPPAPVNPHAISQPTAQVSANNPSFLDTLRATVRNGPIGRSLTPAMPGVMHALGLDPTQTEAERQRQIAAGQSDELINLRPLMENARLPDVPVLRDIARSNSTQEKPLAQRFGTGVAGVASGMTTPGNAAIMAATGGLGEFAAGAPIVGRLISAGFSVQMLKGLYDQSPQFKAALDRKDYGSAAEIAGQMAGSAGMAYLAGKHALTGGPTAANTGTDSGGGPGGGGPTPFTPEVGAQYVQQVRAGVHPAKAAADLNMNPQEQEWTHVANFIDPAMADKILPPAPPPQIPSTAAPVAPEVARAPVSAPEVQANAQMDEVTRLAAAAQGTQVQAEQLTGMRPAPPPKPQVPLPDGLNRGELTRQTVDNAGTVIQTAPPEQQGQLKIAAVKSFAKWVAGQNSFVDPDGKIVDVDGDTQDAINQSARKIATKIINDEVDRQTEAAQAKADAAQKEAEAQAKQQEEDRKTAEEERVAARQDAGAGKALPLAPDTPQYNAVRQALDKTDVDTPAEKLDEVVRKAAGVANLPMTSEMREAMVQEHLGRRQQQETDAVAGTPSKPGQSPAELAAWHQDVKDGTEPFMHVAEGSNFKPKDRKGLTTTRVTDAGDANGTYYHAKDIKPTDVKEAARTGKLDQLAADWKARQSTPATHEEQVVAPDAERGIEGVTLPVANEPPPAEEGFPQGKTFYHGSPADFEGFPKTDGLGAHFTGSKELAEKFKGNAATGKVVQANLGIEHPLRVEDFGGSHANAQGVIEDFVKQGVLPESFLKDVDSRIYRRSEEIVGDIGDSQGSELAVKRQAAYDQANTEELEKVKEYLQSKGYDGLVYDNKAEGGGDSYVVFDQRQIRTQDQARASHPDVVAYRNALAEGKSPEEASEAVAAAQGGEPETEGTAVKSVESGTLPAQSTESNSQSLENGGRGQSPEPTEGGEAAPAVETSQAEKPTPFKPGDKVQIKNADGTTREGKVAFDSGGKKVAIKGERKTVDRGDVSRAVVAKPIAPGEVGRMSLADLTLDPKRFQYKLNTDSSGATGKLKDVPWNDALSGVVTAWRDPEDGATYVVNGHHRVDLALRHGASDIAVRMLPQDVKTPEEARVVGALQNIAEGNGTSIDAAKFMRDTTYTPEDLARYGVSLSGPIAEGGTALARLDPKLFEDVVGGRIPERRGIAIGNAAETPAQQETLLKMIARAEAKGRTVTNATIDELGRMVKSADDITTTQDSLFGTETRIQNVALEKAEVSAYLRGQIASEKKLFGGLTSASKAETLAGVGKNLIDTKENATAATSAQQAQEIYDRLSTRTGPVDDILNVAAKRIAGGENANTVKSEAYRTLRTALSEAIGSGQEAVGAGSQEDASRPETGEGKIATLPGMESAVDEQHGAAEDFRTESQKKDAESSLTAPKANISKATGEMERNSPLFRDSEASGQGGLFGSEAGFLDISDLANAAEPLLDALEKRVDVANVAGTVHDTLQNLDRTNKATTLQMKDTVRAMADSKFSHEDGEQVFKNLEDPSVPLTPNQIELRDKYVKPLNAATRADYITTQLIKSGKFSLDDILAGKVPPEEIAKVVPSQENYQHRVAVGKDTLVERLIGETAKKFGALGGKLSRTFSSEKTRTLREIHGPDGEREAVAVKGDRVIQFVNKDNAGVLDDKIAAVKDQLAKEKASKSPDEEKLDNLQRQIDGLNEQKQTVADGGHTTVDLGPHKAGFITTKELADEAAAPLEKKLAAMENEFHLLHGSQARVRASTNRITNLYDKIDETEKQIAAIRASIGPEEQAKTGLTDDELLAQQKTDIEALEKRVAKFEARQAKLQATEGRSPAQERELKNIPGHIEETNDQIAGLKDSAISQGLEGKYWRDKNGKLWKFNQGTADFISQRTGQEYFTDARMAALANHLEVNKAMNAAVALEHTKTLLEDRGMGIKVENKANAPEGWKPTTLPQFRDYYFPEHIADALDQFHYKQMGGQDVLQQVNGFLMQTILMNPLMHIPNVAMNALVGKAAEFFSGKGLDPSWYADNVKAGLKAVNVLKDLGGKEYQHLLRVGLDLRGSDSSFDATTKDIMRQWTDQLRDNPEHNAAMSALLKVKDAAQFLQKIQHQVTFGANDAFTLQSFYAKRAELIRKGMDTDTAEAAARDYVHLKGVGEYTTPAQLVGSSGLARLADNPLVNAFWHYHYGYLIKPLMTAIGDAVGPDNLRFHADEDASAQTGKTVNKMGETANQQRAIAIARLAFLTLFATTIKPLLDKAAKEITGNPQAEAPDGGQTALVSSALGAYKDEHNVGKGVLSAATTTAGRLFIPSPTARDAVGLVGNYDTFLGRKVRNPNDDVTEQAKQVGAWLLKGTYPAQLQVGSGGGGWQKPLEKFLGVKFPLHDGIKAATEIRSDERGKLPSDPVKTRTFQAIMAAAEQAHRSGGQDTSLADALYESGQLSKGQEKELGNALQDPPIVFAVGGLKDEDVYHVFQRSSEQERTDLLSDDKVYAKMDKYQQSLRDAGETTKADKVLADINPK